MGQYYYLDGSVPVGPFSLQDAYTLIDRGVVEPTTMVCREGGPDWQLLLSVPELCGKSNASTLTRGSSSGSKRHRSGGLNLNVIIVAVLFSLVAIYVAYTISHAGLEPTQTELEIDRRPTQ